MPFSGTYNGYEIFMNESLRLNVLGGYNNTFDIALQLIKFYFDSSTPMIPYEPPQIGVAPTGIPNYYKVTQEFLFAPQYLSPLNKILVVSGGLKSRPQLIQTAQTSITGSSANNTLKVVFSFSPDNTQPGTSQSELNYYSSSFLENNILDLQGDEELNSVDVSIYWQDKNLNLYPLVLFFNNIVSLLFLFSRI